MPDACTESRAHGKAFCDAHCEYLLSEAPCRCILTGLKEFLKYCEVVAEGTYNNHKHGSAYSRTEPENAKTGCQDLSSSARWARTEFINVFI